MMTRPISRKLIVASLLPWGSWASALEVSMPQLVSVQWDTGAPTSGTCGGAAISADGRFVTFVCSAGDLVPGDLNGTWDTFVLDRQTGVVERVSLTTDGQEMPSQSGHSNYGLPAPGNGDVAFMANGPLHPDFPLPWSWHSSHNAFYLRDRSLATTELISRDAQGQALNGVVHSGGRFAWFDRQEILFTFQGDLRTGPNDSGLIWPQLWIRNWATGAVELVSGTPTGQLSVGGTLPGDFTPDGRYVLFGGGGNTFGPPAREGDFNLYLRDRVSASTSRLTFPASGGEFTGNELLVGTRSRLSADGRYFAFSARGPEIHPDVTGPLDWHAYVFDRQTGAREHVSPTPGYRSSNDIADMSADGRYVVWYSRRLDYVGPNPWDGTRAIWILDRRTGRRANVTASLGLSDDWYGGASLSADGSVIAFTWSVFDPTNPGSPARSMVYVAEVQGTGPAPPVRAVPVGSVWGVVALVGLVLGLGLMVRRNRRLSA